MTRIVHIVYGVQGEWQTNIHCIMFIRVILLISSNTYPTACIYLCFTKMPKTVPITCRKPIQDSQILISKYHSLIKEQHTCTNSSRLIEITAELERMGGLNAYQQASLKGGALDKGFGATGTWLVKCIRKMQVPIDTKIKMLDVGAITGETYLKYKFLEVTSIDLNSQSLLVKKQDFFDLTGDIKYDIIGLSLVVNFVPEHGKRGQMLFKSRSLLNDGGRLFLVLPLACVNNSRYFDESILFDMMTSFGFVVEQKHLSQKLAYYLFRKVAKVDLVIFRKKQLNNKPGLNNFSITFDPSNS